MSSPSHALAALSALFQTPAFVPMDAPEPPTHLDGLIQADAASAGDVIGHRWYVGRDPSGVQHIFRFPRGGSVAQWHDSLRSQRLVSVSGPYRTMKHAQTQRPFDS